MTNLNTLITDEDAEVTEGMPELESADSSFLDSDLYKNVQALFTSIESIKNKQELLTYIRNKTSINKRLASEVQKLYNDALPTTLSKEHYTEMDSRVNFNETVLFMESDLQKEKDSAIQYLRTLFEKGVKECEDIYTRYVETIKPKLEETYSTLYLHLSNRTEQFDENSILFYNEEIKDFVNVSPMTIKEIEAMSPHLRSISEDEGQASFSEFYSVVMAFKKLFERNPVILKSILAIVTSNKHLSMDELYHSVVMDNDITIKDIFHFFISSKGYFYVDNVENLIDFVVNLIFFKLKEFENMKDEPNTIAAFAVDIETEIKEIRDVLEFLQKYINGMIDFLYRCTELFQSLKI